MEGNVQLHATAALPPAKEPDTLRIEGSIGPTTGLDFLERRQFSCLCRESNDASPINQRVV
jgi:hypothetical protein